MDSIDATIEEYKSLRNESLDAIKSQQTTLSIGIGTVGVVVAAGVNIWDKSYLPSLIFLVFNPILCYWILLIWLGEVHRMMRAGAFLSLIESKINLKFKVEDALSWESWLRKINQDVKRPRMFFNYIAVIGIFYFTAVAPIIVGNIKLISDIPKEYLSVIYYVNSVELIIFSIFSIYTLFLCLRIKKLGELRYQL